MSWFKILVTLFWCFLIQGVASTDVRQDSEGADIAFIIDSSGSILAEEYVQLKTFVKAVMMELVKNSTKLNAAVVLYSTGASVKLNFSQKFNLQRFISTIDKLPHELGISRTDKALIVTSEYIFTNHTVYHRHNVPKIAILITDGQTTGIDLVPDVVNVSIASAPLKKKGVRTFAVGIGGWIDKQELLEITERKSDLFVLNGFSQLSDAVDALATKIRMAFGWPLPAVKWLMNGKELRNGDLNQTVSLEEAKDGEQFNLSLHFSEVNTMHAGTFTCEAQNKYHTKERNIQVSITCPPMFNTLTTLPPRAQPSGNATLRCEVYGLDYRQLNLYHWQWKFQEIEIKKNTKYQIFFKHQPPKFCQQSNGLTILQITNVSKDDLGQYTCALQLSNTTLTEKDIPFYEIVSSKVPLPPTFVNSKAIKCGRGIKVEWIPQPTTEPAISPITGYELNLKSPTNDLKQIINISGAVLSHEFVGLKTNAVYEVNLRAKNSEGFGLWAKEQLTTTAGTIAATTIPLWYCNYCCFYRLNQNKFCKCNNTHYYTPSANTRPYYTRLSPPDRALRKTLLKAYILGNNYVV
ncbi:hypothetical protein OS493_017477 [Desmophyllum pertusum]|uniref:Uncharacterized protein n=1 Tax=Desmophyllum pertusum TaxID=174260 RepID=A0A9X0D519_9CNID|nr:hypothetical protein OS493_017477 [Desmophyllum pertusum]